MRVRQTENTAKTSTGKVGVNKNAALRIECSKAGIMVPKGASNQEMYDFLVDHYVGTTGSGLRRTGKTKSVTDTVDFGDYGLSQGDLNNGILGLYDYSGQPVKREKLPPNLKNVIKDMIHGEYAINEDLSNHEYNKLKEILDFVGLPNPLHHERRSKTIGKGDLLSLKRKFEILTGEYNAGNNNLGPQIVKVIKEMENRGLINNRLAEEGIRMYKDPIVY